MKVSVARAHFINLTYERFLGRATLKHQNITIFSAPTLYYT
jgi:hypothetical protein